MSLILTIINQAKPGQEISKAFETDGTIGRALKNSWVLIDPNRFISSQHASIRFENNNYHITDTSTNGLFINRSKQPLGKGNSTVLKQGDVITIGEYEISVSVQASQGHPAQLDDSPFGISPPIANEEAPFQPSAPAAPPSPAAPSLFGEEPAPLSTDIESDASVDPLAMFNKSGPSSSSPLQQPQPSASSLDDLLRPASDSLNSSPPPSANAGSAPNHASPLQQNFQPPQMIPDDWDLPGSGESPPAQPAAPEQIPPLDFEKKFAQQPAAPQDNPPLDFATPPTPEPPRPPATVTSARAVSESAVLQSLLSGLHMESLPVANEDLPTFTRTVGEVTRVAIQGMLTALRARSSIKSEFRMSMTTIQAKENNPLKFSITLEDALKNMFQNQSNSYLPPTQAMQEGFNDLEAHMIAVMAGMQVALNAVLRRFDPENLERDFEQRQGGFATMLPGGKKAKHWDAYLQHYKDIIASAEDDFQTFFGDEFTRAYEEQVRKLKQSRGGKL